MEQRRFGFLNKNRPYAYPAGSQARSAAPDASESPSNPWAGPVVAGKWCAAVASCVTDIEVLEFNFTWRIRNFGLCGDEVGEMLESCPFSAAAGDACSRLKWRLRAYPRGYGTENRDYLSVFLVLESGLQSQHRALRAKYKFSVLNAKGAEGHSAENAEGADFGLGEAVGFERFVELECLRDRANGLLPNGSLTIVCDGIVGMNRVRQCQPAGVARVEDAGDSECTLADDFGALLESRELSDVTLSAGGQDLHVHKAVLAARSSVFAAMFKSEMEESKLNRVTIEDVDFEVLQEMVNYIYRGKSRRMGKMSADLLVVADRYDLGGLRAMCETTVCSSLTVDNVVELLILADMHCFKQLKKKAIGFVNEQMKDVIRTSDWETMILTHPHLINEVLGALVEK